MRTVVYAVFFLGSNPNKYSSLDRTITFQISLGIHLGKTGEKLVYYHLYHKEASLKLDVFPQNFEFDFSPLLKKYNIYLFGFKLTITYNDTTYLVLFFYKAYC